MLKTGLIVMLAALMVTACDDTEQTDADAANAARVRDSGRGLGNFDMFVVPEADLGDLSQDGNVSDDGVSQVDGTATADAFLGDGELTDTAPLADPDAAPPTNDEVFTAGLPGVLARYELNGNTDDASGNERVLERLGGRFMATEFGQGLMVNDEAHGLDWSAHAALLTHPFSIEMVFTPMEVAGQSYAKLFGTDSMDSSGWYLQGERFAHYPGGDGPSRSNGRIPNGERVYIAVVSASDNTIHVYINGERGTDRPMGARFQETPPAQALFFKTDGTVSNEEPHALIEALRISSVNRSADEIADVQARLAPPE